jgi:diadenylate cyclase
MKFSQWKIMNDLLEHIWRPAIEILLLAVGIYYAFTFMRGTRGASIVTGFLAVILTLSFISSFLQLTVLRWLLGSITTFFVVAVIVIFQPEIRRMLAQVGNLQLFTNVHEQRENIEMLVQTVERLAEVRIGALIAIEQTNQLRDMVESGVPVDCIATPEMLETIFFPNNAIHDGGVILKGDRITHAACIFPLTRRQDLNRSLGTRHRAAIGLSEETDSLVVAVSEETGAVSYAYKGQLTRGVTLENLRAFLSSILVTHERPRKLVDWWRAFRPSTDQPGVPSATATPSKPSERPIIRTGTDY